MKRLALVGFPDGLARQDIAPTSISYLLLPATKVAANDAKSAFAD
jgi:hypothetical protein